MPTLKPNSAHSAPRSSSPPPPSRTERLRVLRAFYRRQIVSNAWAPTRRHPYWTEGDTAAISNTSDRRGVRLGLFAAFEPWELQQVDHADYFITRLCMALRIVGEEEATAAATTGPANTLPERIGDTEYGDLATHVDCLVRYMREHPGLADAALRRQLSLPRFRESSGRTSTPSYFLFARRYALPCLNYCWQLDRLRRFPDPARDQLGWQLQGQEGDAGHGRTVRFVGDAVHLPPFGWTDALDGRYTNWFGEALVGGVLRTGRANTRRDDEKTRLTRIECLSAWRGAGLALWDRKRVQALKELDCLSKLRTGWVLY